MNKIKEVTVTKLFGYEGNDFTVKLRPEQPVTFIHGFNGSGKTTLLRLLDAALSFNLKALQSIQFETLEIKFDTKDTLTVTRPLRGEIPEIAGRNDYSKENSVFFYKWNDVLLTPIQYLGEQKRERPQQLEKIHVKLWYANPLQDPNNAVPPDTTGEGTCCYKFLDKMDYLQRKIKEFKEDIEYENYRGKCECFVTVINGDSGLVNKSIDIDSSGNITVKVTNMKSDSLVKEDELPLSSLSSGEKNLLSLYFQLIFELPDKGSCKKDEMYLQLLDEPELSMHPDCLVDFCDTVDGITQDLGRSKNYQLLVATHSPLISFNHRELVVPMWRGSDDSADNDDGTDR